MNVDLVAAHIKRWKTQPDFKPINQLKSLRATARGLFIASWILTPLSKSLKYNPSLVDSEKLRFTQPPYYVPVAVFLNAKGAKLKRIAGLRTQGIFVQAK